MKKIPKRYKYVGVFLTLRCNLKCHYCINDPKKEMNRKGFKELSGDSWIEHLNEIDFRKSLPVTFSGGEPMMHRDFIKIINGLREDIEINILTNLFYKKGVERLIAEVNPKRIRGSEKYPSIRASYHPLEMDKLMLIKEVTRLKEHDFNVGIESVMYPSDGQLTLIEQMAIMCRNAEISFRPKSFVGEFSGKDDYEKPFNMLYGNFSTYPKSIKGKLKKCDCRTSELLIGPWGNVHRCHRDLYKQESPIGNITEKDLTIKDIFRKCNKYGECNPCDVKDKTDSNQSLGHTSVEIINIREY